MDRQNFNKWLLVFACLLVITPAIRSQEYELVWADEFNNEGLPDPAFWSYENGFVRNRELQWYQEGNACCKDGLLIIEARHEKKKENVEVTSSSIKTKGKKEFLYGRFEIKARIPTAGGAWPAIWTLGSDMEWPSSGEIDIMEYYRIKGEPHILANAAWGTEQRYNAKWKSKAIPFTYFTDKDPDWASKFHIWRMDWDENAIKLYLDDELLNEIPLSETVNGSLGDFRNPFKQPHYILINLAIGGINGGEPDFSAFPMKYEVDYVRVYRKKKKENNNNNTIRSGEIWPDNNGIHVNAHGGGLVYHNGKYYWFGEHKSEKTSAALVGITCYSSTDLVNWTNEGVALSVSDNPDSDIVRGCVMERPKVIYNEKTGKFVMWFHLELKGEGYAAARAAVAVSDTPQGPYTYLGSGRVNPGIYPENMSKKDRKTKPDITKYEKWWTPEWRNAVNKGLFVKRDLEGGQMSRDMTLYVDDDGKGYHIYSSEENLTLQIAELTDDYLGHSGAYIRVFPGGHNEAPAIFKKDGTYWMITSGCTGWEPNEARMFSASSIRGPWTQHPNPCVGKGSELTFGSQSTYILSVPEQNMYIFMADMWHPEHPIDARYLWLPIQFDDSGKPFIEWKDEWTPGGKDYHRKLIEAGKGYSKTSVNTTVFRNNSIVTHGDTQYIAYYDSDCKLVLGKRRLNSDSWELSQTQYTGNCADAHNIISLMVDGDGYLHVSFDHHGHPLKYCKSIASGSLQPGELIPMTGIDEENVTYPEFYRMPGGDLIFVYRSGSSGRGNLVMNRYVLKTCRWERVHDVLIDGEDQRNAYWQLYVDHAGTIHLSWVWRESWLVETNHDLCYARSRDGGKTWEKSNGEKYTLPINAANAEYSCRIPQNSELINQTGMTADRDGNPYIATYWRDADSDIPQYRLVWFDGSDWRQQQVSNRKTPFSLSGGGTKMIPISRPRLVIGQTDGKQECYYIFRDKERDSKVSMAYSNDITTGKWQYSDLTDFSVGAWEPSHDTELWKNSHKLHLFVQHTEQGDGEKTVDIEPQPVYVLEVE